MIKEYDVVELTEETPDLNIGARGAVVMVHPSSPPAYEVEFVDDEGRTMALLTLRADQLRKVDAAMDRPGI